MQGEIAKKSYYLPKNLMDLFASWCKPGRDYSPKIAGAILLYMNIKADIREACEKVAYSNDIKTAMAEISKKITNTEPSEIFNPTILDSEPSPVTTTLNESIQTIFCLNIRFQAQEHQMKLYKIHNSSKLPFLASYF